MTKTELTKLIKEILSEETINFDELKKHQAIIRKEQDYLLDVTKKLNIDPKLVGNFNQSLNVLMDAIFKAQK